MAKKYYGGRALLNQPGHHYTAAIVAEVKNTAADTIDPRCAGETHWVPQPQCVLQFSDCSRAVCYEFVFGTAEDHENNFFKVRTMIEALQDFERGLRVETNRYEARRAAAAAKVKE